MVFFIVHFPKIQINYLSGIMVFVYFITATLGLINLMLVIVPRIRNDMGHDDLPEINATFFGGIIQFQNPVEYAEDAVVLEGEAINIDDELGLPEGEEEEYDDEEYEEDDLLDEEAA